jgi:hypothetical protein
MNSVKIYPHALTLHKDSIDLIVININQIRNEHNL